MVNEESQLQTILKGKEKRIDIKERRGEDKGVTRTSKVARIPRFKPQQLNKAKSKIMWEGAS